MKMDKAIVFIFDKHVIYKSENEYVKNDMVCKV